MAVDQLEKHRDEQARRDKGSARPRAAGLVVCVDAGGTSCKVAVMSADGEVASAVGGPCNVTTTGVDAGMATIAKAVQDALDSHPATSGEKLSAVAFSRVWVGMAGYDRESLRPVIDAALSDLFKLSVNEGLRVTTDIDLLPAALSSKHNFSAAIVLVVGTGSIAMSYKRNGHEFHRTARVGGWGRVLGDDGSGYATGREGIRKTLRHCDLHRLRKSVGAEGSPFPPLARAVLDHFQGVYPDCDAENLLSMLLVPPGAHEDGDTVRTKNIAGAASVVLSMAVKDAEARQIIEEGAASVAELVEMLVMELGMEAGKCALVLGGGLMGDFMYKKAVLGRVQHHCGGFGHVEFVGQPSIAGVKHLLDCNQS